MAVADFFEDSDVLDEIPLSGDLIIAQPETDSESAAAKVMRPIVVFFKGALKFDYNQSNLDRDGVIIHTM